MDRKPKFRSRKLDFSKPLTVYREYEIDDLEEAVSASRSVPLVATGVDKEEEEEHHLQAAINASQANSQPVYIPIPDASKFIDDYDSIYQSKFKTPKSLILTNGTLDDFFEPPGVWYSADDDDVNWLKEHDGITPLQMETLISKLEHMANEIGFSNINESYLVNYEHLNIPMNQMKEIFFYWQTRRVKYNGMVKPGLKFEDVTRVADHYVCFRRREIKLQHRKTRRSDTLCLDKLRRLRSDFESIKTLLEMVTKRDKFKKESFILDGLIYEQAKLLERWNSKFGIPVKIGGTLKAMATSYAGSKLKRKTVEPAEGFSGFGEGLRNKKVSLVDQFSKVEDLLQRDVNRCQISRDIGKQLKMELERRIQLDRDFDDNTLAMEVEEKISFPDKYYRLSKNNGFIRCRVGRGGRIIHDRRSQPQEAAREDRFPISLKYLTGPELAITNNSQVQNYNQHYISATSQLTKSTINYVNMITATPTFPVPALKKKRKIKKEDEGIEA